MSGFVPSGRGMLPLVVLLLLVPLPVLSQYDGAPPPAAWALEGVTVVRADGREEAGMTLVVRGGIIETLRAGAAVPGDARRIDWPEGTLRVYPGFVDAHGSARTSFPTPDREGINSWNPTREVQFFTPRRTTADHLTADGGSLAEQRRRGVIASAVFPGRGVMPGQPSLILHRTDARVASELVLRPSLGLAMAFQGAQGAYPGTLMAQHAFIRQAFLDAEHHGARTVAFANDPRGMVPERFDADLDYLQGVAAGRERVFFQANTAEDIRRVLALSADIGFRPVVVGGHGAGELADELRAADIAVLIDADFPEPSDWSPGENGELSPAAFRERARLEPIYGAAAALDAAGVPFAFTSGGNANVDLLEGARRAVEYGLSEVAALRALTSGPAELLGAPHLVRLEEGMAANFVVTDRSLLHDDAGIVWTFVAGRPEKGRDARTEREAATAEDERDPAAAAAVMGRWQGTFGAGQQQAEVTLVLREGPDGPAGTAEIQTMGSVALEDVRVDGSAVSFTLPFAQFGGARAEFSGTVEGDRFAGSASVATPQGSFPFDFELRRAPDGGIR